MESGETMRHNGNGTVTMKSITFYITLFVMLTSLASGAYGLSRVYTDNKVETVNTRVDGVQKNIDDKFCDIKETLVEIKMDLREMRK